MNRLAGYLVRLFSAEAIALFSLAAALLFLAESLRMFDVVAVKGQDLGTLAGQVMLTMPTLAVVIGPVCAAIGLARALRTLQQNRELDIIHSSRRVGALVRAISIYIAAGALVVVLLTHVIEPLARRHFNDWNAKVAVDLVSRLLKPEKFVEMTPGVTMMIGARGRAGELGSFFLDDRRGPIRRTYVADRASIAADDQGYVLRLAGGSIQYMSGDLKFSEISFARYDLAVGNLAQTASYETGIDGRTSLELFAEATRQGPLEGRARDAIAARFGEAVRLVAFCLLAAALAIYPEGRRRRGAIPLEIVVLSAVFADRAALAYLPRVDPLLASPGTLALIAGSLAVLLARARILPGSGTASA
jgi:lipopolysaccharide export system permease protein